MSDTLFALVDCNNFYCSCERVFRPDLVGQPIVVLSNNDGCIIARSNEAKALGITMGAPYFKAVPLINKHNIRVFSSNYPLYGDMSRRVMEVLSGFSPNLEVYSIDEAFLSLDGFQGWDLWRYAEHIKMTVEQYTGIPVSVGIGPTKTLAKVANRYSKKADRATGVYCFANGQDAEPEINEVLEKTAIADVWGVGRRWSEKLMQQGIYTALDLKQADAHAIRQRFNVVLGRTAQELSGQSCLELEEVPPVRQQVLCSRSFGVRVNNLADLRSALSSFVCRAAEKLRGQGLMANAVNVHISTSPFDDKVPPYSNAAVGNLSSSTSDSVVLNRVAQNLLGSIFRPGLEYQRAGVLLLDLVPVASQQMDMFDSQDTKSEVLMQTLDTINERMGRGKIRFARQGWNGSWKMSQQMLSKRYTTRVDELREVR